MKKKKKEEKKKSERCIKESVIGRISCTFQFPTRGQIERKEESERKK